MINLAKSIVNTAKIIIYTKTAFEYFSKGKINTMENKREYISETLETPVSGEYDVIVAGAGPAGCASAISAARCGMSVLLIERGCSIGGMFTQGLVTPLFDAENKTGLAGEIRDEMKDGGNLGGMWDICFRPQDVAVLMEQKLYDAGVTVMDGTFVVSVMKNGGHVSGVITESKRGREAYKAKVVIDCTGDGDLCASAGVPFEYGDENGKCQSCTMMFAIDGTDFLQKAPNELADMLNAAAKEHGIDYVCPFNNPYVIDLPGTSMRIVQLTHMESHALDPVETAKAAAVGRKQIYDTLAVMKLIPIFKDVRLVQIASMLGIRESRRIHGKYTLTAEDATTGATFPDGVTRAAFGIDIHPPKGGVQIVKKVVPYEIPLRSMLAEGFDNLMMAGRCISGTHEVMASYRVTGDCLAMGDACGIAAAEYIKTGTPLEQVPIKEILNQKYSK